MNFVIDANSAEWLVQKKHTIPVLLRFLQSLLATEASGRMQVGSVRLAFDWENQIALFENIDYSSSNHSQKFGYLLLGGEYGLFSTPTIASEVFERALSIIKARLRNYFIDGSYIHRSYENGAHTCIAGRGAIARQTNLGFVEVRSLKTDEVDTVLVVGPQHDFGKLVKLCLNHKKNSPEYAKSRETVVKNLKELMEFPRTSDVESVADMFLASQGLVTDRDAADYEVTTAISTDFTIHTYEDYVSKMLSGVQRRVFESNVIYSSPLRIIGPAGSGKTLLMQLLAVKIIKDAQNTGVPTRCLYLVHNDEMIRKVKDRFLTIYPTVFCDRDYSIEIDTLYSFAVRNLGITNESVIDSDAYEAKQFQLGEIEASIRNVVQNKQFSPEKLGFLSGLVSGEDSGESYLNLVMNEISCTIKGQGLHEDRDKYLYSEIPLSRLHSSLNQYDRELLFDVFTDYNNRMFNEYSVLDTDDIAITLLSRLRTPLWGMQRKAQGFDYIFIDEAQLFNENERKLFSLLPNKKQNRFLPVILALDAAQDLYSQFTFSLSAIGIPDITNENLENVHRSTREVTALAFFIIQKSTSLFTPDFPDFTKAAQSARLPNPSLDVAPMVCTQSNSDSAFSKFVLKRLVSGLKKSGQKTIAVVCFCESYWEQLTAYVETTHVNVEILESRGEKISETAVILSKPQYVGGQEFDSVILVGLEQGVYPGSHYHNAQLQATVEEQSLREVYLAVSRARHRVVVALSASAAPNQLMKEALDAKLLAKGEI